MALQPIDFYNGKVWKFDQARPILQREEFALKLIRKYSKKRTGNFLDVGCGDGQFLGEASRALGKNWKYFGVDYSKYRLSQARKATGFSYKWCNLEVGIPHKDGVFDVVYSGEVLEHIYSPDFMIQECGRILSDNGFLVITTPNLHAWYNRLLFLFGVQPIFYETSTVSAKVGAGMMKRLKKQETPVGHIRLFNKRALKDLLELHGFEVVSMVGADFQALPSAMRKLDRLMGVINPGLTSNLVVIARKGQKK